MRTARSFIRKLLTKAEKLKTQFYALYISCLLCLSLGSEQVNKGWIRLYMTHSQMLEKVESGGGPIFKVVLEC